MKKGILGFIAGIVTTVLVLTLFVPALASSLQTIEASLNSINLYLNGEKIASIGDNYTLANGSVVPYSLLYKGNTFLPLREVGRLLGADVNWEGSTRTVNIDTYAINEDVVVFNSDSNSGDSKSLPSPDTKSNSLIEYTFTAFDSQFTVDSTVGQGGKVYTIKYNGEMSESEFCDWWNGLEKEYIENQLNSIVKEINTNYPTFMPMNLMFKRFNLSQNEHISVVVLQIDENGEMFNCTVYQPPHIN